MACGSDTVLFKRNVKGFSLPMSELATAAEKFTTKMISDKLW